MIEWQDSSSLFPFVPEAELVHDSRTDDSHSRSTEIHCSTSKAGRSLAPWWNWVLQDALTLAGFALRSMNVPEHLERRPLENNSECRKIDAERRMFLEQRKENEGGMEWNGDKPAVVRHRSRMNARDAFHLNIFGKFSTDPHKNERDNETFDDLIESRCEGECNRSNFLRCALLNFVLFFSRPLFCLSESVSLIVCFAFKMNRYERWCGEASMFTSDRPSKVQWQDIVKK